MSKCRKCHEVCEESELHSVCHKSNNHAIWCSDCINEEIKKNESNVIKCVLCGSENNIMCEFEYVKDLHNQHDYRNDMLNGENIKTYFYNTNILESIVNYKDNLKYGVYIEYYQNGKKSIEANYKQGIYDGIVKKYDENGLLTSNEYYVEGKYNGIQSYYINGIIDKEITYVNGVKNGTTTIYYCSDAYNGSIAEIDHYKDDIIQNSTTYDAKTKVKKSYCTYKDGELDGFSYTYDENGNQISCIEYKNGNPFNGLFSNHDNKNGVYTQNYKDGLLEGDSIIYYDNEKSKIKMVTPCVNDKIHGIVKKYDEYGNLIESIEYVNGEKHGKHDMYLYKKVTKKIEISGVKNKKNIVENERTRIYQDFLQREEHIKKSQNYCEKNDYVYKGNNKFSDYASFNKEEGESTFMDEQFEVNQSENQNMMETEDAFMKRIKEFSLPYEFT